MLPASLRCDQLQCPSQWPWQRAHHQQTEQCLRTTLARGWAMAARHVEILTNDNVCLGSGLFDDGRVVQSTVDELRIGVLGLNLLAPILIPDEECVLIVRVLLLKSVEGVTTDVTWLKVPVRLSRPLIEEYVSAKLTGDSGPGSSQQCRRQQCRRGTCWEDCGLQEDLGCHVSCRLVQGLYVLCTVHLLWLL